MPVPTVRSALLPFLAFGLLAAGCLPTASTVRYDRRVPTARHAAHRAPSRPDARAAHDARRYVRDLDRTLRLDWRQEDRIERLLTERATEYLRYSRVPASPFPRRYDDRATRAWWRDTDRRIERELDHRQRRAYRDLVRHRDHRHEGRHCGHGDG